jgi:hypothetical protein
MFPFTILSNTKRNGHRVMTAYFIGFIHCTLSDYSIANAKRPDTSLQCHVALPSQE